MIGRTLREDMHAMSLSMPLHGIDVLFRLLFSQLLLQVVTWIIAVSSRRVNSAALYGSSERSLASEHTSVVNAVRNLEPWG